MDHWTVIKSEYGDTLMSMDLNSSVIHCCQSNMASINYVLDFKPWL